MDRRGGSPAGGDIGLGNGAAPPRADRPHPLVGRLIAQRWYGTSWYVGLILDVRDAEESDSDGDSSSHDEAGSDSGHASQVAEVLTEDGLWCAVPLADLQRDTVPDADGPVLCPVGDHGRPLRGTRRDNNRYARFAHGLVLALDPEEGRLLVATAKYTDDTLEPCMSLALGTREDRLHDQHHTKTWSTCELEAGVVPDARLDDGVNKAAFATMWARIRSPPAPPAAQAMSEPAPRRRRPGRAGPGVAAPGPRPRGAHAARRIGTAPEADATDIPESRRNLFGHVLDGLDPGVRFGYQQADRDCTLEGMRQLLHQNRQSLTQRARPYRPQRRFGTGPNLHKGQLRDATMDAEVGAIGVVLMGGKRRTVLKRRSLIEGFRQACASRQPPTAMLPLTAENVTHWWTRSWLKGLRMSRLGDCLAAVTWLSKSAGLELEQPYPGIDPFVREDLILAKKALQDLDGSGVRRAFPVTLRLLGFLESGGQQDLSALADLQFWARALTAHGAMLRAEDHCRGRPRWGDWKELAVEGPGRATWMIRPGKAHSVAMPAEFGSPDAVPLAPGNTSTKSGPVMALYRARLRESHLQQHGAEPPEGAYLFPEITATGINWDRYANDKDFIQSLRDKARAVGCPKALCARLQFHGFRSGGASDWFNYGHGRYAIIQFIMRQGRWRSTAFRVYIRLRGRAVAQIMSDVFEAARREDVPGSDAARRSMELLGQLNTNGPGFTHARGPME